MAVGEIGPKDEKYREEVCGFADRLMPVAFDYKSYPQQVDLNTSRKVHLLFTFKIFC